MSVFCYTAILPHPSERLLSVLPLSNNPKDRTKYTQGRHKARNLPAFNQLQSQGSLKLPPKNQLSFLFKGLLSWEWGNTFCSNLGSHLAIYLSSIILIT